MYIFFYREWTSEVTGTKSEQEQEERLTRQVNLWKGLSAMNRDLIISGDANLCAKSWHNPDYYKKNLANIVMDFLLEESIVQLVEEFTRTELKGGNIEKGCIDHIYSNCPNKCSEISVLAAGNSDHLATILTKLSKEIRVKPRATKKRSYKNFVEEEFMREVKYTSFKKVLDSKTPEEATESFRRIFCSIIDNHAPIKVFQTRRNYAPWLSKTTKSLMDDRLELKNQSKTSDDPKVLQKYRKSRNEIKEKNKSEKKSHYQNKFKKANDENDRSQMWNTAYEILGSKKNLSPTQLVIDGKLCSNPQKMAEEFNKVFIEKVKNLKNNLSGQVSIDPADRLENWLKKREDEIPLLEFRTVKEEDLIKYIRKLKGKKSCGFDQIDSCLLKTAAPYIKDVLLHVINLNIQNHFSIGWKTQLILPNYKKGDKLSAENYRPVSNIPELSKVLEYAIFDQLMEHFLSNNLFHPNHHGFLPYHNTSTALAQMFYLWARTAEDQELCNPPPGP